MEQTNILSNSGLNTAGHDDNHNKMEKCPVCWEDGILTEMCPNKHKLCNTCLIHVRSIRFGFTNKASCPCCRAEIDYVPLEEGNNRQPGIFDPIVREVRRGHGRPRGQEWRDALTSFIQKKNQGLIPANAEFGGIHKRKCGHKLNNNMTCQRRGGDEGVRFLIYGDTGKRRYRCECHDNY